VKGVRWGEVDGLFVGIADLLLGRFGVDLEDLV
jgi:hypothetical protein